MKMADEATQTKRDEAYVAKLEKDFSSVSKSDRQKTKLLNTLSKENKLKQQRLIELEARVKALTNEKSDVEQRQATEEIKVEGITSNNEKLLNENAQLRATLVEESVAQSKLMEEAAKERKGLEETIVQIQNKAQTEIESLQNLTSSLKTENADIKAKVMNEVKSRLALTEDVTKHQLALEQETEAVQTKKNREIEVLQSYISTLKKQNSEVEEKLALESQARARLGDDIAKQRLALHQEIAEIQNKNADQVKMHQDQYATLVKENTELQAKLMEESEARSNLSEGMTKQRLTLEQEMAETQKSADKEMKALQTVNAILTKTNTENKEKLSRESGARLNLLEEMAKQRQAADKKLSEARATMDQEASKFQKQEKELGKEIASLNKKVLGLQGSMKQLSETFDETQSTNATLKSLNQDMTSQIQSLQDELASLQQAKASIRGEWSAAAKKNKGFQKYLKTEKERVTSELKYWKDMNETLYESLTSNQKLLEEKHEQIKVLTGFKEDQAAEIQMLSSRLASQQSDHDKGMYTLKRQVESLTRKTERLQASTKELKSERNDFRDKADANAQKVTELEAIMDVLNTTVTELREIEAEKQEVDEQLAEAKDHYKTLQDHHDKSQQAIGQERMDFQSRFDNLMKDHKALSTKFEEARAHSNAKTAKILEAEMDRQVQAVVASTQAMNLPQEFTISTFPSESSQNGEEKSLEAMESRSMPLDDDDVFDGTFSDPDGTKDFEGDESDTSSTTSVVFTDEEEYSVAGGIGGAEAWFWNIMDRPAQMNQTFSKDESVASLKGAKRSNQKKRRNKGKSGK